jgi:Right handed beta helix region
MHPTLLRSSVRLRTILVLCAMVVVAVSQTAAAKTLCVNPSGSHGCYSEIQDAVKHAAANDIIEVAPGTYHEEVDIGLPVSLIGAGAHASVIDATSLAHGIFVDGYDNPGLDGVTIAGFSVQNALYEGILVVSATDVTIRDNTVKNNDSVPNVVFTGDLTGCPAQPGSGIYEMDETGDCGGAIHLVGAVNAIVSDNFITGNADGILISDETGESRDNLIVRNIVKDNPLECGIVLASHPPAGHSTPPFPSHNGVNRNTVAENISSGNGVQIGGAGAGLFSDGAGQGHVTGNVIIRNQLTDNGLGGVALHTHVGPAFGLPADDFSGNQIIGNFIAGNLADQADTATPGKVGININSGGGGSPVTGTVISQNVIRDEDVDVAVNTPAQVDLHLNDLRGAKIGVADVCAFDGATICTGSIDATQNYWGCPAGPGGHGCSTASGADIRFSPWLKDPIADNDDHGDQH